MQEQLDLTFHCFILVSLLVSVFVCLCAWFCFVYLFFFFLSTYGLMYLPLALGFTHEKGTMKQQRRNGSMLLTDEVLYCLAS